MSEFESEAPKEEIEKVNEKEPTCKELAEACKDVLDKKTRTEIEQMDNFEEALGYVFTCLIENGIENPEEFLIEKGILEKAEE